ncbi:MAG TPA: ABC transporter permease [Stellaceae bacterium]|nr:ABC transporter permease [Stellaceae bacterium]
MRGSIERHSQGLVRALRCSALAIPAILVLAFLTLPILAVIPMSFSSSIVYELIPANPGFSQYERFFANAAWVSALVNSVEVGLGTMVVATVVGTMTALGLRGLPARWRAIIEALFLLPQIVPSIVYAVAAYFVFFQIGLIGSLPGLVVAHSVLALPFVVIVVGAAAHSLNPTLLEASRSLGAGSLRTFFRVIFPHLQTAIVGSAFFAFQVSFDEVILALFITGPSTKTLPVKVWDAIFYEISPILPAISTLIILVPLVMSVPLFVFLRARRIAPA